MKKLTLLLLIFGAEKALQAKIGIRTLSRLLNRTTLPKIIVRHFIIRTTASIPSNQSIFHNYTKIEPMRTIDLLTPIHIDDETRQRVTAFEKTMAEANTEIKKLTLSIFHSLLNGSLHSNQSQFTRTQGSIRNSNPFEAFETQLGNTETQLGNTENELRNFKNKFDNFVEGYFETFRDIDNGQNL